MQSQRTLNRAVGRRVGALAMSVAVGDGPEKDREMMTSATPLKLTYLPGRVQGPAAALALEFSGLHWVGSHAQDTKSVKQNMPSKDVPVLEIPCGAKIGQENAILNYIGRHPNCADTMGGASEAEFIVSQQLMCEADDLSKVVGNLKDMPSSKDLTLSARLESLEAFHEMNGTDEGRFTAAGCSVGECKLFAALHALKSIESPVSKPSLKSVTSKGNQDGSSVALRPAEGDQSSDCGCCKTTSDIGAALGEQLKVLEKTEDDRSGGKKPCDATQAASSKGAVPVVNAPAEKTLDVMPKLRIAMRWNAFAVGNSPMRSSWLSIRSSAKLLRPIS
jgi:hypothetical protein